MEHKPLLKKPKVFSGKTTDNFRVWHKSVQTYFQYMRKKFTIDANKSDWPGGRLEGKALFWDHSHQKHFEMYHHRYTWLQYEEALFDNNLSAEEDKWDLKRMSALRYQTDSEDYMSQKPYYDIKLGPKALAWVAQIPPGLLAWFKDSSDIKL
jgi:hypothetical protein